MSSLPFLKHIFLFSSMKIPFIRQMGAGKGTLDML